MKPFAWEIPIGRLSVAWATDDNVFVSGATMFRVGRLTFIWDGR